MITINGKTLKYGAGTFEIADSILLQNASLLGAGDNQTTLTYTGLVDQPFIVAVGNSYISDIYLSGGRKALHVAQAGSETLGTAQLKMKNVAIRNGGNGLYIRQSQISHFDNVTIQNNSIAGIYAETANNQHNNVLNTFSRCNISSNQVGVHLVNMLVTVFRSCVIQENGGIGFLAKADTPNAVRWLSLLDNYFERNGAYNTQFISDVYLSDLNMARNYFAPELDGNGKIQFKNAIGSSTWDAIPGDFVEVLTGDHPQREMQVWSTAPAAWPDLPEIVIN